MSKSKFAYPLFIEGGLPELRKMVTKLEEIGYNKSRVYSERGNETVLSTICYPESDEEGMQTLYMSSQYKTIPIEEEDLIFALVRMKKEGDIEPGEHVIMEKAGGWGYAPKNDGCIAIVTERKTYNVAYSNEPQKFVESISGRILNPNDTPENFTNVPSINRQSELVWRRATEEEITNFYKSQKVAHKKIIGYKSPTDLFNGEVKAGTLYGKDDDGTSEKLCVPIDDTKREENDAFYSLAPEIVETWEPVYEEFNEGDYIYIEEGSGWVVKDEVVQLGGRYWNEYGLKNDHFTAITKAFPKGNSGRLPDVKFRKATAQEIEEAKKLKVGEYEAEFYNDYVKFGCQRFTIPQIEALAELFKRESEVTVELKLNGVAITSADVTKVLSKLKSSN